MNVFNHEEIQKQLAHLVIQPPMDMPVLKPGQYVMGLDVVSPISRPTEGTASVCVVHKKDKDAEPTIEYVATFRVDGLNPNKLAEDHAKAIAAYFGNCYIMKEG